MNFVRPVRSSRQRDPEHEPRIAAPLDAPAPAEVRIVETLAERVLAHPFALPGHELVSVRLVAGELPRLPFALPLLPGATVIGSVLRTLPVPSPTPDLADTVEVVLDIADAGVDVGVFYDSALTALGWTATYERRLGRQHGFIDVPRERAGTYCRGPEGPWLIVTAVPTPAGNQDVHILLDLATAGPCSPAPERSEQDRRSVTFDRDIPALVPPRGLVVRPGGGGGSEDSGYMTGHALTDRPVADLAEHYRAQLEHADWRAEAQGADAQVAWSVWRVASANTRAVYGLFLVTAVPERPYRQLFVYTWSAPPDNPSG